MFFFRNNGICHGGIRVQVGIGGINGVEPRHRASWPSLELCSCPGRAAWLQCPSPLITYSSCWTVKPSAIILLMSVTKVRVVEASLKGSPPKLDSSNENILGETESLG